MLTSDALLLIGYRTGTTSQFYGDPANGTFDGFRYSYSQVEIPPAPQSRENGGKAARPAEEVQRARMMMRNCHQLSSLASVSAVGIQCAVADRMHPRPDLAAGEFNLLYAARRDGFTPREFHRRCDHKGPTLTMVSLRRCPGVFVVLFNPESYGVYHPENFRTRVPGNPSVPDCTIGSPLYAFKCTAWLRPDLDEAALASADPTSAFFVSGPPRADSWSTAYCRRLCSLPPPACGDTHSSYATYRQLHSKQRVPWFSELLGYRPSAWRYVTRPALYGPLCGAHGGVTVFGDASGDASLPFAGARIAGGWLPVDTTGPALAELDNIFVYSFRNLHCVDEDASSLHAYFGSVPRTA